MASQPTSDARSNKSSSNHPSTSQKSAASNVEKSCVEGAEKDNPNFLTLREFWKPINGSKEGDKNKNLDRSGKTVAPPTTKKPEVEADVEVPSVRATKKGARPKDGSTTTCLVKPTLSADVISARSRAPRCKSDNKKKVSAVDASAKKAKQGRAKSASNVNMKKKVEREPEKKRNKLFFTNMRHKVVKPQPPIKSSPEQPKSTPKPSESSSSGEKMTKPKPSMIVVQKKQEDASEKKVKLNN